MKRSLGNFKIKRVVLSKKSFKIISIVRTIKPLQREKHNNEMNVILHKILECMNYLHYNGIYLIEYHTVQYYRIL